MTERYAHQNPEIRLDLEKLSLDGDLDGAQKVLPFKKAPKK
jgi:hypothetical protein